MSDTAKHIPLRKCVACRESKPKAQMLRVVSSGGDFFVDTGGKADGRGAYVCRCRECVEEAKKKHRFEKSFRSRIPAEIYTVLEELSSNTEVQ